MSAGGTGTRTITYDPRGNVRQLGSLTLSHNHIGQLRRLQGSADGWYFYDAEKRRTRSSVNGRTSFFVHEPGGGLLYTGKNQPGEGITQLRLENGHLVAKRTDEYLTYVHADHLGTPLRGTHGFGMQKNSHGLQAAVGDEVFHDFYTPFGLQPTAGWHGAVFGLSGMADPYAKGSDAGVYGLTGHARDAETGLTYMQARHYDPVAARFLSTDPVTFLEDGRSGMVNRYSYTLNDPVNMWDSDGRQGKKKALTQAARAIRNARARGRRAALKRELSQLNETGQSISNLSAERASELRQTGNLKGMHAHHDPSVSNGKTVEQKVAIAENPDHITFQEPGDHRKIHQEAGGTRVPINSKGEALFSSALGVLATSLEGLAKIPDPYSFGIEYVEDVSALLNGEDPYANEDLSEDEYDYSR